MLPVWTVFATTVLAPQAQVGGQFDLYWTSGTEGGGGLLSGGDYILGQIGGQPDAGPLLTGGNYSIWGGLLQADDIFPLIPETNPPTLLSFSFVPTSICTADGAVDVTLFLQAADDNAGVSGLALTFESPSQLETVVFNGPITPVAGTPTNGTFQEIVTFPQGSEQGTWQVSQLMLTDAASNASSFT
ncbi:hypothetical protein JXA47_15570, partial [Candidatus Sumerlaeota bacterium]|nr:hypothetical protein [Candidatus Sumerlaeota bacterium]